MKKMLLPLLIIVVGVVLIVFSFLSEDSSGNLEIKIRKADLIMPAVHKVYANPDALNGQYYLFKAMLTNNGRKTIENVTMKYRVPGYIEWTELGTLGKMIPGQSVVVACYPVFDPKITEKTTESIEKVEVVVDWEGVSDKDIIEESFSFKMLSRNDFAYTCIPAEEITSWSDIYDNDKLIACFVTPNDPIVKYYTQIVQEKVMKGEAARVQNSPELGVQFLLGLYEATRMAHMVYSSTKGIPQSLEDVETLVQHVRLPREVITGNTGLCIELSTLYASVLSAAGLSPVIFMVPQHAYPGFKMNGQYFAIEATGIGGEGLGGIASAEEAFKAGMKNLEEFIKAIQVGDPRYSIVDIHEVNSLGVTSMNLEDNEFLRRKVDDIALKFSQTSERQVNTNPRREYAGNRFPGPLSFSIPSGWQTYPYPAPNIPILTAQVISPDQMASVSVYDIPANSAHNAMQLISQYFSQNGLVLEYKLNGNAVSGTSYSSAYSMTFKWKGRIAPVSEGFRLVAVGAESRYYGQYSGIVNSIYNSIN